MSTNKKIEPQYIGKSAASLLDFLDKKGIGKPSDFHKLIEETAIEAPKSLYALLRRNSTNKSVTKEYYKEADNYRSVTDEKDRDRIGLRIGLIPKTQRFNYNLSYNSHDYSLSPLEIDFNPWQRYTSFFFFFCFLLPGYTIMWDRQADNGHDAPDLGKIFLQEKLLPYPRELTSEGELSETRSELRRLASYDKPSKDSRVIYI